MSGGEFWIMKEFKFSYLNSMDRMFFKAATVLGFSGAFSNDEARDLTTSL